jgi:hypothetical protein
MDRLVGERPHVFPGFSALLRAALFGGLAFAALGGAAPLENAVIANSGSTNSLAYKITVSSDGSATLAVAQDPAKNFTVPAATTTRFFADLAAARKGNAASVACMKSASFGTTTKITWQGWTSADLDCPPKDDLGTALATDVDAIRAAAGMKGPPLRSGSRPASPSPEDAPAG